jgi:hypothetical protein
MLISQENPWLPEPFLSKTYLSLSWAVVLVAMGLGVVRWLKGARDVARSVAGGGSAWRRVMAILPWALGIWALLPAPWSASYWLGLAFQAPSLLTTSLCAVYVAQGVRPKRMFSAQSQTFAGGGRVPAVLAGLALCGIAFGWLLLLDALNLLHLQVFAWGFSPLAVALGLCVAWAQPHQSLRWTVWLVMLVYVITRLPTGNVWDALLDPFLWIYLHVWLFRRWFSR